MLFQMHISMLIMILTSNLIQLNDIHKLWTFEVEGSKWSKRHYHTLRCGFLAGFVLTRQKYVLEAEMQQNFLRNCSNVWVDEIDTINWTSKND